MLNKNTKKLIALGVSLATLAGATPAVISPVPVFASEDGVVQTPFDSAKANLDNELNKVEFSSATKQEDIDSILKDFSYTTTTTGTAVTITAATKDGSFSNDESKSTCSFSVNLSDGNDSKSFEYSYTYEKVTPVKANLQTSSDGAEENVYGTVITINITGFYKDIVIAGVNCTTPWHAEDATGSYYDLNVVVDKLKAAKESEFTVGYKLISADVVEYEEKGEKKQRVVVKLGTSETLTAKEFPLSIASFDGNILVSDGSGIHDSGWAMYASLGVDKSALENLYNAHYGDTKGTYTDASWSTFTTALTDAKTIIDKTDATKDEVTNAKTNLETAISKLVEKPIEENVYGTILTINITGFYKDIVIAGVNCTTPWHPEDANGSYYDLNVVVDKLKAAKESEFTVGYKLVSADVVEYEEKGEKKQRVVVKLGTSETLTAKEFPLSIASFDGNILVSDGSGIHDSGWAMYASLGVDKIALENLYNAHYGDAKGTYTDASWSTFTTALTDAKTIIDKTDATKDEVTNAKTNLETAINGLKKADGTVTVTKITVDGADAISVSGGNITLKASVSPDNATNKDVTWSIVSGGTLASLSDAGVLTASKSGDGSVVVKATAKDGSGINGEKTITISNNTIISPSPSTGGGGSHRRSTTTTTSDTKTASETKSAETVVKSTDESSIVDAIKGAKTVVINASNAGTTNTTLISAQVLSALKASTDTTLVIKTETSTIEVKAIGKGQIQFTENKVPITGAKTVGNNDYYLNDNGIMQTGWEKLSDGTWNHYNLETGVKEKGWFKDPSTGKLYYLDDTTGAMKTGWLKNGGLWYYFNGDGSMKTGWLEDSDGLWYYLDTNGAMVNNTIIDGYTINAKGVWIK